MNLVAKEFVAARHDNTGVLMISEFAGAARELTRAITVNPRDIDAMADALLRAITIPGAEAGRRMRSMRNAVRRNTVFDWCDSFIEALERGAKPGRED
jgi:trehalose 6-phosphate synthase